MSSEYNPANIEAKWQRKWEEAKLHEVDLKKAPPAPSGLRRAGKKPYYTHVMFPYPSGDRLHVGHWYNFGPADSYARYKRMQGLDVFAPMGFDAFGLPAENYAIKTGIHPAQSMKENVETMTRQLKRIGCMYDWSKSVNTSTPEYYRWTQWLFLQMFKHDLAYQKEALVNFCPGCKTVLANEQVWEGRCERCESDVTLKPLKQWFLRITNCAQRLLDGLDALDWPEKTKTMQRNWIGRKEGIDIAYEVKDSQEKIVCFTTRPDTNFGATFIVLAPEHEFVRKIMNGELKSDHRDAVSKYAEEATHKTELQRLEEGRKKTGTSTGFNAINNLTGTKMPIWVGDFVLSTVGTGAVVGVPGHDTRDFEFAKTFKLPIIRVVVASDGDTSPIERIEQVQEAEGTMINSEFLNGLDIHEATKKIMDHLEEKKWGKRVTTYRLRDWSIGRQRYWGAPIPIVYDPQGNPHPIPEERLPWLLPTDVEFKPTGTAPLAQSRELKDRVETLFGKGWTPEVDTMDTFVDSSFYSLMYLSTPGYGVKSQSPITNHQFVDRSIEKKWLPVSCYIGGAEHACMHLIYARFVTMALKDFGFVSHEEPYRRLVHQGVITNKGAKMSKSKGNVVSPDVFIERHGSDVFRMELMFMGPYTEGGNWSDTGIKGIARFANRVHTFFATPERPGVYPERPPGQPVRTGSRGAGAQDTHIVSLLHRTIKKVGDDLERFHFNTALSALMIFLNEAERVGSVTRETAVIFTKLLAPLAPHLAEELWEALGQKGFVIESGWPKYDEKQLKTDTFTLVVQVNGKVRANVEVLSDISEAEAIARAKEHENVRKYIEGKKVKKEMYVPGELVSLVV